MLQKIKYLGFVIICASILIFVLGLVGYQFVLKNKDAELTVTSATNTPILQTIILRIIDLFDNKEKIDTSRRN